MTWKNENNDISDYFKIFFDILTTIIFIIIILSLFQSISLAFSQISISIGERNVELEATLTGSVLPNKPINFYYRESGMENWIYIDTVYTDSEGKAKKIITLQRNKNYDFKAEFTGDEEYEESTTVKYNIMI